ncbi:MAG: SDR family oxidoreductase [Bacteroidota bacterium]
MNNSDYLRHKTVVITGISKGIGKALTLQLLDAGATVVGWGRTAPDYAHEDLHFFTCDVSDEHSVAEALKATQAVTPDVDFLVNNAGFGYFSPIESFDISKFRRMLDVNLTGTFLVTRAVVPTLKKQKSGHIINISSIAGRVGAPQGEGYNASKFGVTGLTECLFKELRKEGIKVTTVYPGSTATNFFDEIPGFEANDRMLNVDELAGTIVHLMNTSPRFLVREIEIRPL